MSYIGKQPRKAALTSSDIEDGIITAAKIEDGAVVAAEIASNAVTTAKINADAVTAAKIADNAVVTAGINADAVTGAKIADDAVNSEHYTDGSIDTAHLADGQITTAKLATAVFTGATDIGADIADADLFLMDDGAGGTIRKTAASRIKTYAGGLTGVSTGSGNVTITDGNLIVASGHGIDFAATGDIGGTGSELLNDYEEGTWTPTFVNQSGTQASNYTNNSTGQYVKIGRMVWVNVFWSMGTISTGPGSLYAGIGGFPFVADGSAGGSPWYTNIDVPHGHATFQISNNASHGIFYSQRDNANYDTISPGAISSNDGFNITFCYKTD
jgi:hypothetical protein